MAKLRKITVAVPARDLEAARAYTGAGITETVRIALKTFVSAKAQQELLKLRGTVKFSMTAAELRDKA
jgi:hypothetical protein